eukprot:988184-Rhodomonas_salina.2
MHTADSSLCTSALNEARSPVQSFGKCRFLRPTNPQGESNHVNEPEAPGRVPKLQYWHSQKRRIMVL